MLFNKHSTNPQERMETDDFWILMQEANQKLILESSSIINNHEDEDD
jgi:hypothetical protein